MKLYEIANAYETLWSMVEDDEADLQMIEDTLQSIEGDLEEKVENMIKIIRSIEAEEKALKEEESRLNTKRKARENKRESIKKYLEQNLITMGINKVKTKVGTVNIQNNPQSIEIIDEEVLLSNPESQHYWIPQPKKLDKKKLLEDLKAGKKIEGVVLKQTKSLRIR